MKKPQFLEILRTVNALISIHIIVSLRTHEIKKINLIVQRKNNLYKSSESQQMLTEKTILNTKIYLKIQTFKLL